MLIIGLCGWKAEFGEALKPHVNSHEFVITLLKDSHNSAFVKAVTYK